MKKYEICVVSREYRTVHIDAENEELAEEEVWNLLADGLDTLKVQGEIGLETEVYVQGEVKQTDPARELANQIFGFKGAQA